MQIMILLIIVLLLFLLQLTWFQIGSYYKVYAKKQDQGRRVKIITGAGIIIPLAWSIFFGLNDFAYPGFLVALLVASIMGLVDDIWEVPLLLQLIIHLVLVSLLFSELGLLKSLSADKLIAGLLFSFLTLLIVSKHDGVNGLLLSTSLVFFITTAFLFPNTKTVDLANPVLYPIFALLVLGWYNFREKALVFMGATGRIALSYLMLFLIIRLLLGLDLQSTENNNAQNIAFVFKPQYLMFFAVMGLDFVQAILRNLFSRKSFSALPMFYNYLTQKQVSVFVIAIIYAGLQSLVNYLVISNS